MADQIVSFTVTELEQARLANCVEQIREFGRGPFALVEDVIARKAWNALPEDAA